MRQQLYITMLALMTGLHASAQDAAKSEDFKPSGKVWGYVFGDYYYKMNADSSKRGNLEYAGQEKDYDAFSLRRAYLGYDYNISEHLSTEILLSHESNVDANSNRTVFIKAANLRIKNICKSFDIVIGQVATPSFPLLEEKIWGYRSVEKTIADQRKIAGSNDLGITMQGKFNQKGTLGYNLMIGNGSGTKLESDKYKRFYGDLWAKFFNQKLVVDLYGDYERVQLSPYYKGRRVMKAFVAYQTDPVTIGVTYVMQTQEQFSISTPPGGVSDTADIAASGFSVFVRGPIKKDKLNFFARFDSFNPDNNFKADNAYTSGSQPVTETFITAGLDWMINKNVHIMPNFWYDGFNSRAKNASGKVKSDNDAVARITAYFVFK